MARSRGGRTGDGRTGEGRGQQLMALPLKPATTADSAQLRLRRVVDSFEVNQRAKESIAHTQLTQFHDLLCAKLRQQLSLLEARIALAKTMRKQNGNNNNSNNGGDLINTLLLPLLTGGGGLGMLGLGGGLAGAAGVYLLGSTAQSWLAHNVSSMEHVIAQFSDGGSDLTRHSEHEIKRVATAIALRYIDQVVALNKDSHSVLCDVVCDRILRHLHRSHKGYQQESRKPLVAQLQRWRWHLEAGYHSVMTAPDRVPQRQALDLVARCVRALTAEAQPETDERQLHYESWFTPSTNSICSQTPWTAGGLLSRSGLRVKEKAEGGQGEGEEGEGEGEEVETLYVHEFCDTATYGYAYGDASEARERRMYRVVTSPPPPPPPPTTTNNSKL